MPVKPRKIPQRQCVGCRTMYDKRDLLRVVKSPEGDISFDTGGKKSGRGAYVCRNGDCLKKAQKTKALDRALEVTIPEAVYAALQQQMEEAL